MGFIHSSIISFSLFALTVSMTGNDRSELRQTVKDMFRHAYDSYMTYAYPADELMPLSCKGRYRDTEPHRGDVDDILGNFSMTLIDSLDSLAIFGEVKEFERGIKLVIDNVQFDNDIVVSVFETNIRVLGGLLGGHVAADVFKSAGTGMSWYHDELLEMAKDMGERLLPAFNTTTGIPYPRVNLKYGVADPRSRTGTESDTCTACAGTMIMEFGALSRLTGDPKFEAAAHKAMMALWTYRSRSSDLVGTVINIHNGEWVRRDSGVGAGIDSYYEYCLKAYILLGEEEYLQRFNQHYKAVMRYINRGSLFLNVHMNNPTRLSYSYMDSLQAFWPGLQVLKGDLKSAIELHEVFYSVAKRHTFLPEAFTASFEVHWGQHLLRPELVESTYFLYEATKDPYYLEVGKYIVENLNRYTRVPCGFAAVKDVRTLSHEDRMDSFLLSETLKYLYLLFTDKNDLPIDLHDFVFTTEAHILPLALSKWNGTSNQNGPLESEHLHDHSCPSNARDGSMMSFAEEIRRKSRSKKSGRCPKREREKTLGDGNKNFSPLLRAEQFIPGNKDHLQILKSMGISVTKTDDGKVQLMQNAALADNSEMAAEGIKFMQSMIELAKFRNEEGGAETLPRVVQILSPPYNGNIVLNAGPAQFGIDLGKSGMGVSAEVILADPFKGCTPLNNKESTDHRIVVMERGDCMFIDKVRQAEKCGAVGAIIIDNNEDSSSESQPMFAMSGDGTSSGINIPAVFLFSHEGQVLQKSMQIFSRDNEGNLRVRLADKASKKDPSSKHSPAETAHPSSPDTTSSGKHHQPTSDPEPDSVDEKSEEHTAVPEKTATVGQPSPDNRQHSFNQVNKLLELMKNVVNEPGFEFLNDVKRIKSKGSVCGKTTVKRDKDKWLYDIMVANMKDKKRWEDFLVKRRTMGKAAREPLIKDKHDKDSFGVYQEKPTDGDISGKDFAGGKIDSARQMSDSSDSTFYVQSDVRDDEVFVVGTVNDEIHAANGQVVGMLSTEKTAGSVESEQPTEGEGERRAEEIEKENSPEISEVDKRQTSRIKIRQSCGDTDGTNRRKHIVCGEIITENKRETTREKDRTDMSQKTDKENREESSGSGGENLENVEQESSQILSRRADQETSEKAYEETSKEEIEKTDKEINAEKQHRDGEFSTRIDEQRTILPTEETGEDRSESTSENSIHETRKIEEGIVSHVEISIENERVARLDTRDNSNLENDKSDSEESDPRTNVDPELNWQTKTPLNLNERANENTK